MMEVTTVNRGRRTFARGVHPPERKQFSRDVPIEVLPAPKQVLLPLVQHLGAPSELVAKNRQKVAIGELIAEAKGMVSAAVHASLAGTVGPASVTTLPNARHVRAVPIQAEGDQLEGRALWDDVFGGEWPTRGLDAHDPDAIGKAVQAAGIVGLGGAAFPTHVKLQRNPQKPVETLIVNGCECEPYLTADFRLMLEAPKPIVTGALLAARAAGATRILVAVEDNKPEAAEALRLASRGTGIEVIVVPTKYPMGGERQLVVAVLGREVPTGGLPLDVGAVVINVGTAAAIARAVVRGKPLTHRIVSVSGAGIARSKNLLVPVGVRYRALIEACGGLTDGAVRLISGGPMMGFPAGSLDAPVTKGTSGITVLTHDDIRRTRETACVRCGRCVDVCPLHLVPAKLASAARHADWDMARRYHLAACCECGCCAYSCPAGIPLVQLLRTGKSLMPR